MLQLVLELLAVCAVETPGASMVYGISQDPTGRFRRQQECYGMPHHFRPYSPEQPLLWPPDLRDWLPEDHRGVHGERVGGCAGSVGVLRPLSAAGLRQPALCAGPDHKNPGIRVCHGGKVVPTAGAETGRGCGFPGASGRESTPASDPLQISAAAPGGFRSGAGGSGAVGAGPGSGVVGHPWCRTAPIPSERSSH